MDRVLQRSSIASYRAAPVGRYVSFPSAMAFCLEPTLWGFAVWGAPTRRDIEQLVPLVELDLAPAAERHATLVDLSALAVGDPHTLEPLLQHAQRHHDDARAKVARLAAVRPAGALGMTIAGFFRLIGVPYSVEVFATLSDAVHWLEAGAAIAPLDACLRRARGSPMLVELRAWLDGCLAGATLEDAARCLARSRRTLQRELGLSGTSFRHELAMARVRKAQSVLLGTSASLSEVADAAGCTSLEHLSVIFRALVGETPSGWRRRRRELTDRDLGFARAPAG